MIDQVAIEAVALAIEKSYGSIHKDAAAKAAIIAYLAHLAIEGMAVVPIERSDE